MWEFVHFVSEDGVEVFENSLKKYSKKHKQEIGEVLGNLSSVQKLLQNRIKLSLIEKQTGELRHEKEGVYRLSQSSKRLKETRLYLYFYFYIEGEEIVLLEIKEKPAKRLQTESRWSRLRRPGLHWTLSRLPRSNQLSTINGKSIFDFEISQL